MFEGCVSSWISLRVNHSLAPTQSAAVGRSGIDGTLTENRSPACEVSYRVLVLNNNGVLDLESLRRRTAQILALYTVTRQEEIATCRLPNLWFWTHGGSFLAIVILRHLAKKFTPFCVRYPIHNSLTILPVLRQKFPIHDLPSNFSIRLTYTFLYLPRLYNIIIIIIVIIIFIYCNWVVTRWQWLFYM